MPDTESFVAEPAIGDTVTISFDATNDRDFSRLISLSPDPREFEAGLIKVQIRRGGKFHVSQTFTRIKVSTDQTGLLGNSAQQCL